jgi:hypothetical protein
MLINDPQKKKVRSFVVGFRRMIPSSPMTAVSEADRTRFLSTIDCERLVSFRFSGAFRVVTFIVSTVSQLSSQDRSSATYSHAYYPPYLLLRSDVPGVVERAVRRSQPTFLSPPYCLQNSETVRVLYDDDSSLFNLSLLIAARADTRTHLRRGFVSHLFDLFRFLNPRLCPSCVCTAYLVAYAVQSCRSFDTNNNPDADSPTDATSC